MTQDSNPRYRDNREVNKGTSLRELRESFEKLMQEPLHSTADIGKVDIVVGIPFHNETKTIMGVLSAVSKGLKKFFPDQKCVIVAIGSPAGKDVLRQINALPKNSEIERIAYILKSEKLDGKGWHIRAMMEIAQRLGADLAILEADLKSQSDDEGTKGLLPEWINLLLKPIRLNQLDMVVSRFNRHWFETPISAHLTYPLLTAFYDTPIHDLIGAQWGISHRLLRNYLQNHHSAWSNETMEYGIDLWLAIMAITSDARIGEVNLGVKITQPSRSKAELVLRQTAAVLLEQTASSRDWLKKIDRAKLPLLQPLTSYGLMKKHKPLELLVEAMPLTDKDQQDFERFRPLYQVILPGKVNEELEMVSKPGVTNLDFSTRFWAKITNHLLLSFASSIDESAKNDILASFITLLKLRAAAFSREIQNLHNELKPVLGDKKARHFALLEAERQIEEQASEFIMQKSDLLPLWELKEDSLKPPLPKITYRQFIPNVNLVVPSEVVSSDGNVVTADSVYEPVFHKYKQEFDHFAYQKLKVDPHNNSQEIINRVDRFMHKLEAGLDKLLFPGDLHSVQGTKRVVDEIFKYFPHQDTLAFSSEIASWLLWHNPPYNLITKLDYSNLNELLRDREPNDILAMADLSEEKPYSEQLWKLIRQSIRPEHFTPCQLKPIVVGYEVFPALLEMKESTLNKFAGRVLVSNIPVGVGGEFPKLRYFTHIAKNIVESERYSYIWQRFATEKKDFSEKVANSILGHWGNEPMSAHNIFENENQRILVSRLKEMAKSIVSEAGGANMLTLANNLEEMAESYHLSSTLPDGTFIPCSAWTWASYSFRGGTGLPTLTSLHVERDWTSREFLLGYYKAVGGSVQALDEKIVELMEQGMESEDLSQLLLGGVKEAESIIIRQTTSRQKPIGELSRFEGNPILTAISEHTWESQYVLNPGAISLKNDVYLVYRAVGRDGISRLGLAKSRDGFNFNERLEKPIFIPRDKSEEKGCEDPRLTQIGDRIYMVYTAYGGLVAQIALASIGVKDFLNYRWGAWHRHGLVFPGYTDKDGSLFPEVFGKRYAILHRVEPHIWLTFTPHLRPPWPRGEHKILAGTQSGMMWDGLKIGAGAQPIKTKYGWLLITHGVDHSYVYRLGVMLLDLADPTTLLYRSPNHILEPKEKYEVGESNSAWVPNVVFTCGAVPRDNSKKILEAEDELLVYYGAADSVISIAKAKIAGLIPEDVRNGRNLKEVLKK
jgi:predicted GH43/DUF377 family glycosyl hydrolase